MLSATRALRQAAVAVHRTPSIQFLGRRTWPARETLDQTPKPHPASPTGSLPTGFESWAATSASSHSTFSSYRDHVQQHGPLQKSIRPDMIIGSMSGAQLGSVAAPTGSFFDRSELGPKFARLPLDLAEIEAIESGGAALLG
jgi:small subunit ribosomal protein YMR-31